MDLVSKKDDCLMLNDTFIRYIYKLYKYIIIIIMIDISALYCSHITCARRNYSCCQESQSFYYKIH
jgi:hypothetical protein